jgi:outer membrane protein OmpA-like peptidoglycan-associated protein
MHIEFGSHTDARGSDKYNMSLSKKRAKSAMEYIIKQGIEAERVSYLGYGETNLINTCGNGVECSDELHEENRRTEFKVTSY